MLKSKGLIYKPKNKYLTKRVSQNDSLTHLDSQNLKTTSKQSTDPQKLDKQQYEKFITTQSQYLAPGKSPYEINKNYRVLRDFFNVGLTESKLCKNGAQSDPRYVPFKTQSHPLEMKTYNRFDKDNIFNIFPYQNLNASKSKEDLNTDLQIKVNEEQVRLRTSQKNRSNSPDVIPVHEEQQRVSTSPYGPRGQNKYYTLIEEAMKMSNRVMTSSGFRAKLRQQAMTRPHTKQRRRFKPGYRTLRYPNGVNPSSASKLKSQFKAKPAIHRNAKMTIRKAWSTSSHQYLHHDVNYER